MSEVPQPPQAEFLGYIYFDDPDWWRSFAVTQECAQAIQEFRQEFSSLVPWDGEDVRAYEATVDRVWQASDRVVERMQWRENRDIAVIFALAQLYQECVDRTEPVSYHAGFIRSSLSLKAASIRSLLSTKYGVRSGKDSSEERAA